MLPSPPLSSHSCCPLLFVLLLRKLKRKEADFLAPVRLKIRLWQKLYYDHVLSLRLGVKICPCVCVCVSESGQGGHSDRFCWGEYPPLKQEDSR